MSIEIEILLIAYIISNILCLIVVTSLWQQNRKRSPETALWVAGYLLNYIGIMLILFRGIIWEFFSIVLANLFLIGGVLAIYIGIEQYVGLKKHHPHNYVMLTVFTLLAAFLTYVYPSLPLRNINFSAAFLYISAQGAWLIFRKTTPDFRSAGMAVGLVFTALCVLNLIYIIDSLKISHSAQLFMSDLLGPFILLMYQTLLVATTFALFILVSRTLSARLESELTGRRQVEELIRVRLTLLEFAAAHSLEELLQKVLDEVGYLVDSPIGFYHFVEADQKTLTLQAWSTRTIKEFCKIEGKGMHYGIDQAGIWVDCVREKRTVIHNDYNSLPNRKGLPAGHAAVIRELVVPITREGKIVAILGVGNKPADYTEKDVEIVSYLADVAWEITQRKRAEEQISHMATHDALTDLPTMRLVRDRLSVALSTAHRHKNMAAVMFIDLDGFKSINDTLGHNTGDYVLKQVAERMLSCVRETDTVARVGGDEFLIIATELHSADDAAQIAKKTITLLSQPIALDNRNAVISASIGISLYPVHGEDIDQLIRQADEAMYRVKNSGKNSFAFVDDIRKGSKV